MWADEKSGVSLRAMAEDSTRGEEGTWGKDASPEPQRRLTLGLLDDALSHI